MGSAQSNAESVVNMLFSIAFEVTDKAIGDASPVATQEQIIDITGNPGCVINIPGGITMKQKARMDLASAVENLSDTKMDEKIQNKLIDKMKSEAVGGLGWVDSHMSFVTDITGRISATVTSEARALASGLSSQVQKLSIMCAGEMNIAFIDFEQIDDITAAAFSKNTSTTDLKAELINELDQEGISKAKGFDPTLLIIAIVIVIVIFVFGGFDVIAANVLKPSVWFIVSLAVTAWGIWDLVKGYTHNVISDGDTEDMKKKKEGWHKRDKKWGWTFAGIGGVAALITGFIFIKNSKK